MVTQSQRPFKPTTATDDFEFLPPCRSALPNIRILADDGRSVARKSLPAEAVARRASTARSIETPPPPEPDAMSSMPHSQPRHATGMRLALKRVAMSEMLVYGGAEYYGLHNSAAVGTTNEERVRYTSMAKEWLATTAFDEAIGAAYRAAQGGGGTHGRNIAAPVLHEVGLLRIEMWPLGSDCHAGSQVIRMMHKQLPVVLVLPEPDDAFVQARPPAPPPPPPAPQGGIMAGIFGRLWSHQWHRHTSGKGWCEQQQCACLRAPR